MSGGRLELVHELLELPGIEVREHLAVHVDDRRKCLPAQRNHLLEAAAVRNDVDLLVGYAPFVEPVLRLVTPAAKRFHKQSDFLRFHSAAETLRHDAATDNWLAHSVRKVSLCS